MHAVVGCEEILACYLSVLKLHQPVHIITK